MKYLPLPNKIFIENRKRFSRQMKSGYLAVFNSNDIMPTNADGHMSFVQNTDLFYLSGIDQEESTLLLFPNAKNPEMREILFLKETNPTIAVWEGHKYTKGEAFETSGIRTVYWNSQFQQVFHALAGECDGFYLNTNEHPRAVVEVETRDARFINWVKKHYPLHKLKRSAPIMADLRCVKSVEEVDIIKEACRITGLGFRRTLDFIKPGVKEYEIEAELIHEFIRNRSRGFAYGPIIASGKNACVLHYTQNNATCKSGEVVLMDVAAEYGNYASDLTRCVPVSGKFSKRQKQVYNAVLKVMREAVKMLKPGGDLDSYHKAVGEIMTEELIRLKLLTKFQVKNQNPSNPAYKKYFMHGTSHHLGLDVHDVGSKYKKFEAGMVFTCEPGIYIPRQRLGIRLENDILITKKGPVDLMEDIPIEANEIEAIMADRKK